MIILDLDDEKHHPFRAPSSKPTRTGNFSTKSRVEMRKVQLRHFWGRKKLLLMFVLFAEPFSFLHPVLHPGVIRLSAVCQPVEKKSKQSIKKFDELCLEGMEV